MRTPNYELEGHIALRWNRKNKSERKEEEPNADLKTIKIEQARREIRKLRNEISRLNARNQALKEEADALRSRNKTLSAEYSERRGETVKQRKDREFQTEFLKIRRTILKRDEYKCCDCGSEAGLCVHHIVARKDGGTNEPKNLITMCTACHRDRHRRAGKSYLQAARDYAQIALVEFE